MIELANDYTCWRSIDYRPSVAEVDTTNLLRHIGPDQSALEIGCGTGAVSLRLAQNGLSVLGIDINEAAIASANSRASRLGMQAAARFQAVDCFEDKQFGTFDVVVLARLLTCFPVLDNWEEAGKTVFELVRPGGVVYVNDFARDDHSPIYRKRYAAGSQLDWRDGNFAVHDSEGNLLFIAHHHSDEEITEITSQYHQLELRFYNSRSMNGNPCRMFEFIGRRDS